MVKSKLSKEEMPPPVAQKPPPYKYKLDHLQKILAKSKATVNDLIDVVIS